MESISLWRRVLLLFAALLFSLCVVFAAEAIVAPDEAHAYQARLCSGYGAISHIHNSWYWGTYEEYTASGWYNGRIYDQHWWRYYPNGSWQGGNWNYC